MKKPPDVSKMFAILLLVSIILLLLTRCSTRRYCQPSPHSKDYAILTSVHHEELVYYVTARHYGHRYHAFLKCLPDSFVVGKKVSVEGWTKI